MTSSAYLPALLAGVGVFLFVTGLAAAAKPTRILPDIDTAQPFVTPSADQPFLVRVFGGLTSQLETRSGAVRKLVRLDNSSAAKLERQLIQAGRPWGISGAQLHVISIVGGVTTAIVGTGLMMLLGEHWYLGLLIGAVVGVLPRSQVSRMANQRTRQIRLSVPGMLDLLVLNAEAGGTPRAGLRLVTNHLKGPLAEEVAWVERRMQVGVPDEEALVELASRTGIPDLEEMAMNIVTAVRYGAMSYSEVLEKQAERARLAHRQEAEKFVHSMTIRMLFPVMIFYFPAMMLVFLGPSMVSFTNAL